MKTYIHNTCGDRSQPHLFDLGILIQCYSLCILNEFIKESISKSVLIRYTAPHMTTEN